MVVFQNKGVLDARFITSFGVSVKTGDSPIGYFGTGLKYAIAVLLREGCEIKIYTGQETWQFSIKTSELRGKEFDFIQMTRISNDGVLFQEVELPFTTELGKNWKMWQAFRELYCNCLDEGGTIYGENPPYFVNESATTIVVTGGKIDEEYKNRHKVFLDREAFVNNEICSIHSGTSDAIYYRGVRACELKHESLFTYNIHNSVDLTEDRTIKYDWEIKSNIVTSIMLGLRGDDLNMVLLAPEQVYEGQLDFCCGVTPPADFLDAIGQLRLRGFDKINKSALKLYERHRKHILSPDDAVELNELERKMLDKAKWFLKKTLDVDVDPISIYVIEFDTNTLGCAHGGNIYLSRRCFRFGGTKMVTSTLLEEYLHTVNGWADFDRNMQNYLFDQVISLGEQVAGEPL